MCSSTPEGLHAGEPARAVGAPRRLSLDRAPHRVPADPQVPGQRGDGGVIVRERVDRPPDRSAGEHRARRDQFVFLGPGQLRAVGLGAAPDPLEPDDQHRQPEARRVGRGGAPPSVPDRDDTAARAAGRIGVGLDGDHQLAVTATDVEHVHAVAVEHRIGPGAPTSTQTTPIVVHVGVFISSDSLVATDP
jgi:hypothetical protein